MTCCHISVGTQMSTQLPLCRADHVVLQRLAARGKGIGGALTALSRNGHGHFCFSTRVSDQVSPYCINALAVTCLFTSFAHMVHHWPMHAWSMRLTGLPPRHQALVLAALAAGAGRRARDAGILLFQEVAQEVQLQKVKAISELSRSLLQARARAGLPRRKAPGC